MLTVDPVLPHIRRVGPFNADVAALLVDLESLSVSNRRLTSDNSITLHQSPFSLAVPQPRHVSFAVATFLRRGNSPSSRNVFGSATDLLSPPLNLVACPDPSHLQTARRVPSQPRVKSTLPARKASPVLALVSPFNRRFSLVATKTYWRERVATLLEMGQCPHSWLLGQLSAFMLLGLTSPSKFLMKMGHFWFSWLLDQCSFSFVLGLISPRTFLIKIGKFLLPCFLGQCLFFMLLDRNFLSRKIAPVHLHRICQWATFKIIGSPCLVVWILTGCSIKIYRPQEDFSLDSLFMVLEDGASVTEAPAPDTLGCFGHLAAFPSAGYLFKDSQYRHLVTENAPSVWTASLRARPTSIPPFQGPGISILMEQVRISNLSRYLIRCVRF